MGIYCGFKLGHYSSFEYNGLSVVQTIVLKKPTKIIEDKFNQEKNQLKRYITHNKLVILKHYICSKLYIVKWSRGLMCKYECGRHQRPTV